MDFHKKALLKKLKILAKDLGRRPTKHDSGKIYHQSRKHFGSWNKLMKSANYEVKNKQYARIPSKLTNNLSYFLGLLITDGHLQYSIHNKRKTRKSCVQLFTSYEEEIETILELNYKIFNYISFASGRKNGFNKKTNFQILINSKKLTEKLKSRFKIPTGNKSLIIRIPKIILNSKKEYRLNFLRGIIDGDGSIKPKYSQISVSSGSQLFLKDLKNLLTSLNIKSGSIRKEKSCYVLSISNKKGIEKIYHECYKNAIYCYPRKLMSLEKAIFKKVNKCSIL